MIRSFIAKTVRSDEFCLFHQSYVKTVIYAATFTPNSLIQLFYFIYNFKNNRIYDFSAFTKLYAFWVDPQIDMPNPILIDLSSI